MRFALHGYCHQGHQLLCVGRLVALPAQLADQAAVLRHPGSQAGLVDVAQGVLDELLCTCC